MNVEVIDLVSSDEETSSPLQAPSDEPFELQWRPRRVRPRIWRRQVLYATVRVRSKVLVTSGRHEIYLCQV